MELKNVDANPIFEGIHIYYINTDEDEGLKLTRREEFRDSKAFSEADKADKAMVATKQ
jgi:hypothetical protein